MPKTQSWLKSPRTIATFDIETRLDGAAAHAAGYKGVKVPHALSCISTACMLFATERSDGSWDDFTMLTLSEPSTEFDIMMGLDHGFEALAEKNGAVVTFNGVAHDLSVIRRRAARYWMFGLPGISAASELDHLDLMLRHRNFDGSPAPSMRQVCAGLGVSTVPPTRNVGLDPAVHKCQIDVVATFILSLYEMAIERGDQNVLVGGWTGLSGWLTDSQPRREHLEHFRSHPMLRAMLRMSGA